jgi:hypothetical protein
MATTTLTQIPEKITVPANTNEHDIDFDNMLGKAGAINNGYALLDSFSGTVSFNANNVAIDGSSGSYTTGAVAIIPITRNTNLRYKGGAGSETFNITIVAP